jgi:hypothetical protein
VHFATVFTCGEDKIQTRRKQAADINKIAAVCWFCVAGICGVAVFHRNTNSFAGMQQMFRFVFCAVIDYSVDIFFSYRRRLFHRSAV